MKITYLYGDVREPCTECNVKRHYIVHCCNAVGRMGSGVAKALLDKWPVVRSDYMEQYDYSTLNGFTFLGNIYPVFVGNLSEKRTFQAGYTSDSEKKLELKITRPLYVVNLIGQQGVGLDNDGNPPIRYEAILSGLSKVAELSNGDDIAVHIPYLMGSDRAGGKWELIEKMIQEELADKGISVYVYDIMNLLGLKKELKLEDSDKDNSESQNETTPKRKDKEDDIFVDI